MLFRIFMISHSILGPRYPRIRLHRGQGLVEYALILVFVVIVVVGAVTAVGQTLCVQWYAQIFDTPVFGGSGAVDCLASG